MHWFVRGAKPLLANLLLYRNGSYERGFEYAPYPTARRVVP